MGEKFTPRPKKSMDGYYGVFSHSELVKNIKTPIQIYSSNLFFPLKTNPL